MNTVTNCGVCGTEIPSDGGDCSKCAQQVEPSNLDKVARKFLDWIGGEVPQTLKWVEQIRRLNPGKSNRELAQLAIRASSVWSGRVGFVAGLGDFLGPWGFGAGTSVDIYYAAKLSMQMGMRIYAIYGLDLHDDAVKLRLLFALGGGGAVVGKVAGEGATRVGRKLVKKYLTGALLKAIKAFFRALGVKFTQKFVLAAMPVVGSAVNAVFNKKVMNMLGGQVLKDVETGEPIEVLPDDDDQSPA